MEKRRERRVPVDDAVSFEATDGVGEGTIINLSADGCAFESVHPVDPNSILRLELCIPNEKDPVKVTRARPTWIAGNGMGVQFLSMEETSKARLQRYLASQPA